MHGQSVALQGEQLMDRGRLMRLSAVVLLAVTSVALFAQTLVYKRKPDAKNGKTVYEGGCIACHGAEGRGAPEKLTEFKRPETFPDFTRCDQTTPEPDSAWKATIVNGGPYLGFSTIMPAFKDLLSNDQIDDVVAYLRTFCPNPHWPRGELNLPRAIVTEKAFPENEFVLSTAVNASGAPGVETHFIHEQAFGTKGQLEIDVPWDFQNQNHAWNSHVGDMTLGWKQVMYSNLRSGSIFALQGGILPATGSTNLGGAGTTVFEPFAAFDQLFKSNTWVQFQMGADLPRHPDISPQSLFWYTTLGQTIAQDHRLGRQWSPMVEFLATRDLVDGARTDWDIMPEMQVTLSRRQHVRANVGVRTPASDTQGRSPQVYFYVLWDRAEGHFWNGW
jgi:mono/diheme cytochrome c family protein